ncbi:MAG TPA: efflux transporter outer membrane subunit [Cyclobacteriaceae bacterium]|nr:efflux transporter outer membrane subunit [Cyclobacteriaceae bacterium]
MSPSNANMIPFTFRLFIFGGLLLLGLGGCKVGKNYTQPELDLPSEFKHSLEDSANIAQINWRDFFDDEVLVSLIDTALKNNLNLQQYAKDVNIATQDLKQARVNFLPEINAELGYYEREYHSGGYYSNPSSRYYGEGEAPKTWYITQINHRNTLAASWELDIWGRFRREKEAALATFMQSNEFLKAVQTALVAEVASSYYNLLMLKEQLKVAQRNLNLNDSTLRIVELQYKAGQVTSLAIRQTEAQKLLAASLIPQLEGEIEIQNNNLNQLLGNYPGEIQVGQELKEVSMITDISAGVPLQLITNRPDVAASELGLIAANARIGVAQALKYPSITLAADVGLDAMELKDLFNPGLSLFGVFSGAITQPIFQRRRLKTNYQIALLQRDIAELAFRENLLNAVTEVSNELVRIRKLQEQFEITEQRLSNAQTAVQNADMLFKSGFANYLEVITAQSNALDTELELVSTRMELLVSNIELYRALGGGWQ